MKVKVWPGWLAYSVVTYTFLNLAVIVPPVVESFDVTVGRAGLVGTVLNVALGAAAAWLTFRHLPAKPALVVGFALQAAGHAGATSAMEHMAYLAWAIPTGVGMGMALAGGYRVVVAGPDVGRRTSIITSAVPVTALTTLLGGVFVDVGGWQLAHGVMGGYAALGLAAVGLVTVPEPRHEPESPTREVLARLWAGYVAAAVWAIGMSGVLVFLGAQLEEVFDVGPVGTGATVAMTGVIGFVTTLSIARLDDRRRADLLRPILIVSGALVLGYVVMPTLWLAVVMVGVWSVTYWGGFAIVQAVIATEAGSDQAAALTFFQAPWSIGLAVGPAVVGYLVDRSGFTMMGVVGISAGVVAALAFSRQVR